MESLADWGYIGLFIGSFVASTVIPFSASALFIAVLLAGDDFVTCLLCATIGNWLGGLTSYFIGWIGNIEHIEKWFTTDVSKLQAQLPKIERWGSLLAFFTWLPIVGDVFAIALGFYRINWIRCAVLMLIGRFLRFLVWGLIISTTTLAPTVLN